MTNQKVIKDIKKKILEVTADKPIDSLKEESTKVGITGERLTEVLETVKTTLSKMYDDGKFNPNNKLKITKKEFDAYKKERDKDSAFFVGDNLLGKAYTSILSRVEKDLVSGAIDKDLDFFTEPKDTKKKTTDEEYQESKETKKDKQNKRFWEKNIPKKVKELIDKGEIDSISSLKKWFNLKERKKSINRKYDDLINRKQNLIDSPILDLEGKPSPDNEKIQLENIENLNKERQKELLKAEETQTAFISAFKDATKTDKKQEDKINKNLDNDSDTGTANSFSGFNILAPEDAPEIDLTKGAPEGDIGNNIVGDDDTNIQTDDPNGDIKLPFQEKGASNLPKAYSEKQLVNKIINRLQKHFPFIKVETVEKLIDGNGTKNVGMAIGNLVVWAKDYATVDTLPHEYAHIYIEMLRDTPMVKRALNMMKGKNMMEKEENLVQAIGEYYVDRMSKKPLMKRIGIWLRQFVNKIKNIFNKVPDSDVQNFIAESFFRGEYFGKTSIPQDSYVKFQEHSSIDEDGNDTDVEGISNTNEIPSDLHQSEVFSNLFNAHIKKESFGEISDLALQSKDFHSFVNSIKEWAIEYGKKVPYASDIRTDFLQSPEKLSELHLFYLKEKAKIPRYEHPSKDEGIPLNPKKTGMFTRVFWNLIKPLGVKAKKEFNEGIVVASPKRLDTLIKESEYYTTNFIEEDIRKGIHSNKVMFLRVNDMYNKAYSKKTKEIIHWINNTFFNKKTIRNVDVMLANQYMTKILKGYKNNTNLQFFIGAKPGNNSGLFIGSVPKEFTGGKGSYVEIEEYNAYWEKEYNNGNINDDTLTKMKESVLTKEQVDATLKLLLRKKWFMNVINSKYKEKGMTYEEALKAANEDIDIRKLIESIPMQRNIAIHEHMKSIYHNKWAMNEKHILDTYNRISIPLSEGYSPEGSGDSKVMIVPKDTIVKYKSDPTRKIGDRVYPAIGREIGTMEDFDGATFSSGNWFLSVGSLIGSDGVKALKTVIRSRPKDNDGEYGNDFLGMKHLQVEAAEGMEFYKPGRGKPFAEVRVDSDTGLTYLYDLETNQRFEHIASNNEAKLRNGKFSKDYELNTISDKDIKIIKNPYKSKTSAAHPIALGEMLLDIKLLETSQEAKTLLKEIENHYGKVYSDYLNELIDMRANPKKLLEAVKRVRKENQIPTEAEEYLDMLEINNGNGISHPSIIKLYTSFLANTFLKNGLLKGKGFKADNSTQLYLKPGTVHDIRDNEIMVSSDNDIVFRQAAVEFVKNNTGLMFLTGKKDKPFRRPQTEEEYYQTFLQQYKLNHNQIKNLPEKTVKDRRLTAISAINDFLLDNEVDVLIHRQPIAKVTGVITRRLISLVPNGGQTVYLGKDDVKKVLDGDWDGDTLFLEFIPKPLLNAYKDWQKSDSFKEKDKVVELNYFGLKLEETDSSKTALSQKDRYDTMEQITRGSGAQGRATNTKNVLSALSYKKIKIFIKSLNSYDKDGSLLKEGFIDTYNLSDRVTLKWMPIDVYSFLNNEKLWETLKNNNEEIVEIIEKDGIETEVVVTKSEFMKREKHGAYYLRTTKEHELSILLQMAVDDKKFGLLSKIDYTETNPFDKSKVKGFTPSFPITLLFKRSDGKELDEGNILTLSQVFKMQNYSSLRQGKSKNLNKLSFGGLVTSTRELYERFYNKDNNKKRTVKKISKNIAEDINSETEKIPSYTKRGGELVTRIESNGNITPAEKLIMSIGESHQKTVNMLTEEKTHMFLGDNFLEYTDTAYKIAHENSLEEIGKKYGDITKLGGVKISNEDIISGYEFVSAKRIDILDKDGKPTGKKQSLADEFYEMHRELNTQLSADYNEELSGFTSRHIDDYLRLSEGGKAIATQLFLIGSNTNRVNILRLLPLKLSSKKVLSEYLNIFESKLKSIKAGDKPLSTGKIKGNVSIANLRRVKILAKDLYRKKTKNMRC